MNESLLKQITQLRNENELLRKRVRELELQLEQLSCRAVNAAAKPDQKPDNEPDKRNKCLL